MEDQEATITLQTIIVHLKQQFIKSHFPSQQEHVIAIDSTKEQVISSFFKNDKKVLLALSKNSELTSSYFKHLTNQLWKQEQPRNIVPLYIELSQLRNPFDQLIDEGLTLYGITREQQDELLKSNPIFVLILIGYDQLKTDRPRNLYVTNKLEKFNIQKIIITCHSDYVETKKNYHLFFASYQNKEPQYDKFQEINFEKIELASLAKKETPEIKPVDEEYWHKILTDDLEQLFSDSQMGGYKQPPTLQELVMHSLNEVLLIENIAKLNSLADEIRHENSEDGQSDNFKFKQLCFLFLRYSKLTNLLEMGAANAITILNYARVSFSKMDLRNIRISNADISFGIFDSTQLQGATLNNVIMQGIWLREADLTNTEIEKVNFAERPSLEFPKTIRACHYSPDGRWLAIASGKKVYLYNSYTSKLWNVFEVVHDSVESIDISPDNDLLAVGGYDGLISFFSIKQNKFIYKFKAYAKCVEGVIFNPQGTHLISNSQDGIIHVWKIADYQQENYYFYGSVFKDRYKMDISAIEFSSTIIALSPRGDLLASSNDDEIIELRSITDRSLKYTFNIIKSPIGSVTFNATGDLLAVGCNDLYVWRLDDRSLLFRIKGDKTISVAAAFSESDKHLLISRTHPAAFSPAGHEIAWARDDNTIQLWSVESHPKLLSVLSGHRAAVSSIAFNKNGNITSGSYDHHVRFWSTRSFRLVFAYPENKLKNIETIAFDLNNYYLACGSEDSNIYILSTNLQKLLFVLKGHTNGIKAVSFSKDGALLASGSEDGTIGIWSIKNRKLAYPFFKAHQHYVCDLVFSPNGKFLISGGAYMIHVWSINDPPSCLHTLDKHTNMINSVAINFDGSLLASASNDGYIRLWFMKNYECIGEIERESNKVVAFSIDGEYLASGGDKNIRIWRVSDCQLVCSLKGHEGAVFSLAFNKKGNKLASASGDNTVRIWSLRKLQCIAVIKGFNVEVDVVVWIQRNNQSLLATSDKKAVRIWRIIKENHKLRTILTWSSNQSDLVAQDAVFDQSKSDHINVTLLLEYKNSSWKLTSFPSISGTGPIRPLGSEAFNEGLEKIHEWSTKGSGEHYNKQMQFQTLDKNDLLAKLIKEYKLQLAGNPTIAFEKGLRKAAADNQLEHLKFFCQRIKNINAQGPESKKTALHWAVINQHEQCVETLLNAGARADILDAHGKTAYDYARERDNVEIINLFHRRVELK